MLDVLDLHEQALAAYDSALAIDPSIAYVWRNKAGIMLEDLQRYDEALTAAEHSLDLESTSIRGWSQKELALRHLDRETEAIAAFVHALTFEPHSLTDWQSCGNSLIALHRYEEALAAAD